MALLELRGVTHGFQGIRALDDVHLMVPAGAIHGLIGPNGAGKTTVFNVISGLLRPEKGQILFNGLSVGQWAPVTRARAGIQRVFQITQLFTTLTLREHFKVVEANLDDWPQRLGLQDWLDRRPPELPFGISRQAELALVLSRPSKLLLLDEPAAGLTAEERERMAQLLRMVSQSGRTIVLVEHDLDWTLRVVQRMTVLDRGRVIVEGEPGEVAQDARVRAVYLGEPTPGTEEVLR